MKRLGTLQSVCIAVIVVLTLSGCASLGSGGNVPEPEFEYGWSPVYVDKVDNKAMSVRCLTVEDKRMLDTYIEFLKAKEEME
jgi:uncharacterized protein YceK